MALKSALIVDDSKLARITLRKKLDKLGFTVELAESAEQAFVMIEANCPDIVFMDHLMPDIDGFEATQKLRSMPAYANLPIVMCSGKDHDGYLDEARAIGANYSLIKPPTSEALDEIMQMDFASLSAVGGAEDESLSVVEAVEVAEEMAAPDLSDPLGLAIPDVEEVVVEAVLESVQESDADEAVLDTVPVLSSAGLSAEEVEALIAAKVEGLLALQKDHIAQQVQSLLPEPVAAGVDEATVQLLIAAQLSVKVPEITQQLSAELMPQLSALIEQRLEAVAEPAVIEPVVDNTQAVQALEIELSDSREQFARLQQQFEAFREQDDTLINRALTALRSVA